ncbi:MAG: hypothetical protein ABIK15_17920 [Pseudomonadota bacterium]
MAEPLIAATGKRLPAVACRLQKSFRTVAEFNQPEQYQISSQMKKKKKITIRGIVIPETWNDAGEISTLSIVTYTEKKYLVVENKEAKKLKEFLRKQVIAEGMMTENGEQKNIVIERFERDKFKPDGSAQQPASK